MLHVARFGVEVPQRMVQAGCGLERHTEPLRQGDEMGQARGFGHRLGARAAAADLGARIAVARLAIPAQFQQ